MDRSMLHLLADAAVLAYHDGGHGGSDSLVGLWVFLGIVGTVAWLIFSEMAWRKTLMMTGLGWVGVAGLVYFV
jgi:hypothetical protein